jgi:transcriptional regulator with XRE-family HTH domain
MIIKTRRQQKLLSQEQLAEVSGLSLRTIQRVEAGHRIGYASLKALAAQLDINVETLEQELNNVEKISSEYGDLPLCVRLYMGKGWLAASRREFQKTELFFLAVGVGIGSLWLANSLWEFAPASIMKPLVFGSFCSFCSFLGAYNISMTIRVGDKYDVWSRLEATLPKELFGLRKDKKK